MKAVLSLDNIKKSYTDIVAVDGVSFCLEPGKIIGLLGPNGAGKTTIINMILGVLKPTSGVIKIKGLDIASNRCKVLANTNFAAVYAPLPGNLTVYQNLKVFSLLYGIKDIARRIDELLFRFGLEGFANTKCGLLSSGEQTRVGLAKAMINDPDLLLLDEPTASLDPAVAADIRKDIQQLAIARNCGVLWTSHNMYEVEGVCDHVIFLSHGKLILSGKPKELIREYGKANLEELFIMAAKEPRSFDS